MTTSIILHVGTEKTGSTSIQNVLFANIKALKKQSILVPETLGHPCHFHLTTCSLEAYPDHPLRTMLGVNDQQAFEVFKTKILQTLKAEIEESKCNRVLISDEHICAHLTRPGMMESYAQILSDIAPVTKAIIYLRRQDGYRLSLFSEAVKAGNLKAFDFDNPLAPFDVIPNRFNYLKILNSLSENFGYDKIMPRIFRKDELKNGDSVTDYMDIAGIKTKGFDFDNRSSNPSLNAAILKPLAKITSGLTSQDDADAKETVSHIVKQAQKHMPGRGPKMHPDIHRAFLAKFDEMNEKIKTVYFPDRDEPIFPNVDDDSDVDEATLYPDCSLTVHEFTEELANQQRRSRLST